MARTDIYDKRAAAWRAAWKKACKHAGVPADSKFVVFDPSNPYAEKVNQAAIALQQVEWPEFP